MFFQLSAQCTYTGLTYYPLFAHEKCIIVIEHKAIVLCTVHYSSSFAEIVFKLGSFQFGMVFWSSCLVGKLAG